MRVKSWQQGGIWSDIQSECVHVYKIDKAQLTHLDQILLKCDSLESIEIERAEKFKYKNDRDTYLIARYALRLIASHHLDVNPSKLQIGFGKYGKPFFLNYPNFHFNLSHSREIILISMGRQPIGIDVEYCNDSIDYLGIANSVFSKREITSLTSLNTENLHDAFYRIWTKKEAYIKAIGMGLQAPLSEITMRPFDDGYHNLMSLHWNQEECNRWKVFNLDIEGQYMAALCCDWSIKELEMLEINTEDLNGK